MQSQRSLWKSLYPQLSQPCKQMWNFLEQNWLKYFQLQGFFKILFKIFFTKSVKMFPIYSVLILLKFLFKVQSQINKLTRSTTYNAVISPNFLVWKFCGKVQFPHSFRRIARNYTETVPFRKIGETTAFYKVILNTPLLSFSRILLRIVLLTFLFT